MNPKELEDSTFDRRADTQLRRIEKALSAFDPDEVEAYLGGDVLTITLGSGQKIIINRHRAARQIWMAALRRAWHFDPDPAGAWRTKDAELVSTLEQVLSEQLGRPIQLAVLSTACPVVIHRVCGSALPWFPWPRGNDGTHHSLNFRISFSQSSCSLPSLSIRWRIWRQACSTVVWSRPPNASPISGRLCSVSSLARAIAICRGRASERVRFFPSISLNCRP